MAGDWMTAAEAAARLGVKPQTLYAYVSRGLLHSHPVPGGGRVSRYERAEVDRLAQRTAGGGRAGAFELLVDTELTLLDPAGRLYYRGWDVADAARDASYERVAEWLWTGRDEGEPSPWGAPRAALAAGRAAADALPSGAGPVDRLRVACVAAATTDPLRFDRRPEAVALAGRTLVSTLVESVAPRPRAAVPPLQLPGGVTRPDAVAGRLWVRLVRRRPSPEELAAMNTALALLADHELASSTLAARVAASTWADPYLVVSTGLGAIGGPLHGSASQLAEDLFRDAAARGPAESVGTRLRDGERVGGLGHAVYTTADPRASVLLDALTAADPPAQRWRVVQQTLEVCAERALPAPNIDLALGALTFAWDLPPASGELVFSLARVAGWLAHAVEEYQHRLRFRPRAVYVGPVPGHEQPTGKS